MAKKRKVPELVLNKTQKKKRESKTQIRKRELRNELWKNIEDIPLWNRQNKDGYTTVPRTLPLFCSILNSISIKGKPIGSTYLSLWGRVWDDSFIEIKNPNELAFESGFTGQRAVTTWKGRMKQLEELGFIKAEEGVNGKYSYILIPNPYIVVKSLYEDNKIQKIMYTTLYARSQEIGGDDL